jgi:decaprenylphospho-beta-D-ribofuranose 2-oxidase
VVALLEPSLERGVIARGLARSYGDAAQNAGGRVVDMTGIDGIGAVDPTSGLVTVAAGVSLDALMRAVVPQGWFVPVSPGTSFVTVGGAIAADIHGKNHHADGSFCDHVLSLALQTPDGQQRVVGPDHDSDVFWATSGGMGLTGVITEATIRLLPIETSRIRTDTDRVSDIDELMALMDSGDAQYRYSVAWIDPLARGRSLGRGVLSRGDHAALDELSDGCRRDPLAFNPASPLAAPPWMPNGLIRRSTVRAFNEMWFRKAPRVERGALHSLRSFFHPLDGVRGWNRVYGSQGFLQYQFVVPFGEEAAFRRMVERLSDAQCPSFVTVLKRFGDGHGLLSFPIPGWTLTLDIPTGMAGLGDLLSELDEAVARAGGRVYLAKDSRLAAPMLARMYPELARWQEIRSALDPSGLMRSDLARRLDLV